MRHRNNRFVWAALLVLATVSGVMAQQRFKAGAILGVNASQIDGDLNLGYHKLGLTGGLRGVVVLNRRMEISTELLYSQRGSKSRLFPDNAEQQFDINLNYVSIPVLFNLLDWSAGKNAVAENEEGGVDEDKVVREGGYFRMHFYAGLSYGRLLGATVDNIGWPPVTAYANNTDKFNPEDISWIAGATYFINRNFGISARFTKSFTLLYDRNKYPAINTNSLIVRFLTFQAVYMF